MLGMMPRGRIPSPAVQRNPSAPPIGPACEAAEELAPTTSPIRIDAARDVFIAWLPRVSDTGLGHRVDSRNIGHPMQRISATVKEAMKSSCRVLQPGARVAWFVNSPPRARQAREAEFRW